MLAVECTVWDSYVQSMHQFSSSF
uniref:Uncharacterized protein n=1 Tax=Rhizophora mucronata TaxID=61149 RepID=A0A2P2NF91_RHIMU